MTRILGAALVAALLVSIAPASAQSPPPSPLPSASAAPAPVPSAAPVSYTLIPCTTVAAAAHVKAPINATKMGALWTAALRMHGFDKPGARLTGLDYRKAQLDVDGCFGYKSSP